MSATFLPLRNTFIRSKVVRSRRCINVWLGWPKDRPPPKKKRTRPSASDREMRMRFLRFRDHESAARLPSVDPPLGGQVYRYYSGSVEWRSNRVRWIFKYNAACSLRMRSNDDQSPACHRGDPGVVLLSSHVGVKLNRNTHNNGRRVRK